MSETILDRLDREHGGAYEFIAEQIISNSTNAQIADAIAAKFDVNPPTIRSISSWANNDKKVLAATARLREGGADATRATATVIVALEERLEHPEKLSVAELIEIKKALARQSGRDASPADILRGSENSIDPAVLDYLFFQLSHYYGEEGERFMDVATCLYIPNEDLFDFLPVAADVEAILLKGEETFGAKRHEVY